MAWYRKCARVPWQPPDFVFGIVWPILYVLYAATMYTEWGNDEPYNLLLIGLALNIAWIPLFRVNIQLALTALIVMVIIGIHTIQVLYLGKTEIARVPTYIVFSPYVVWLCFALTLNTYLAFNCK